MTRVFWRGAACLCEGRVDFQHSESIRQVWQSVATIHRDASDSLCRTPVRDLEMWIGPVLKPRNIAARRRR